MSGSCLDSAPRPWRPDGVEAFAIEQLSLDRYSALKEWLHRSWVETPYPDDPTHREMAFFFAHLATVYKLAQAYQALSLFRKVESDAEFQQSTLSPTAGLIALVGREAGSCAGELMLRVCVSASIPALASAFDCLACSLYLLFAPQAKEGALRSVDIRNVRKEQYLTQPDLLLKEIECLEGCDRFRELMSYRNAWVHREAGYLALSPGAQDGPSVKGSGLPGWDRLPSRMELDRSRTVPRYLLLKPDLPVWQYWRLLAIPRRAVPSPDDFLYPHTCAADQIKEYLNFTCQAINRLWHLARSLAQREGELACRLHFKT